MSVFSYALAGMTDLLIDEGAPKGICQFKCAVRVVNVDRWEIGQARRQRRDLNATMDMAALLKNEKILLVEAKFRVKTNELSSEFARNIKAKITYTKPLFYEYMSVCDTCVLLFQSDKLEQHRNRLKRLINNKPDIEVMDAPGFYDKYVLKNE